MIQVEAVRIVEFRGIREMNLTFGRKNFVIFGPNGSGKSGVVDAIQFGLTGEITRLSGKGTRDLSVQKHGPHVDRRNDPAAAEVSLTLYLPDLDKTAVLTRNVKTAKKFTLTPDSAAARAAVEEAALHPELTLSRREIIKYILLEASERSTEIQALLKLEEIGKTRGVLKTASNKVTNDYKAARQNTENAANALRCHLNIKALTPGGILAVVNPQRLLLGLPPITQLGADTVLDADDGDSGPEPAFNKATAIRDLDALKDSREGFEALGKTEAEAILCDIARLEGDPAMLNALRQRSFLERGLDLVDGPRCPLCDMDWDDDEHLRAHLRAKLATSQEADIVQDRLLGSAAVIAGHARRVAALLAPVRAIATSEAQTEFAGDLAAWADDLTAFANSVTTAEDLLGQKTRFEQGWLAAPSSLADDIRCLAVAVQTRPDQSALAAAHSFLALARDRLNSYRQAERAERRAKRTADIGRLAYTTYCEVAEQNLSALYAAVENEFSAFYREINGDDEGSFEAIFEPAESKLDLAVAFYGRGMFPPGAYHSEGHQDGMGVCLYLSLMKHLLGDRFQFAVLDDVVMSVDRDHRKQFCRLLKTRFQDTQFVITTHDDVWARQMRTERLVEFQNSVRFHRWSVETGPIFEEITGVWEEIEADLASNDASAAASRLRRHLEYVSGEMAHELGAKLRYRGDFSYDFGDLLSAVIGRQKELLKIAAESADRWEDDDARTKVGEMKAARAEILRKYDGEQWVINKAIHYNEWANFTRTEFRAVVKVFKALLLQFRCPNARCGSWLYVTPQKGSPESLRCKCNNISLNLRLK